MTAVASIKHFVGRNRWALGLVAFSWLIFFSPLLFAGRLYFLEDLKTIYFPLESYYAEVQRAGSLPAWSNYFGLGQPLLAWGQLGFFNPLHLLLRAVHIPPLSLLHLSMMTYYGLGLWGMFVYLRRHVLALPAALGSMVYVFSGFHIGHLTHINFYTATMLLPWLLLAGERLVARPRIASALLVALLGASMALSGQPQVVAYSFTATLLLLAGGSWPYLRAHLRQPRPAVRLIGLALLSATLALALASFALLPLYEFLPATERNSALPSSELYEFSYPPYHAITLIFPFFFGNHHDYTGPKSFQELAAFTGIIPLLLSGAGLWQWRKKGGLLAASVALLLTGILLTLGRYSPLYTWLVEEHIFSLLTVPGRFVFFFDTAVAVLSALGLQTLLEYGSLPRRRRIAVLTSLWVLPTVLLSGFVRSLSSESSLYQHWLISASWRNPSWVLLWVGAGSVMASVLVRPARLRVRLLGSVVLVAGATLLVMGATYNPTTSRETVRVISPFIPLLRAYEQRTGLPARLFSAQSLQSSPVLPATRRTEPVGPLFSIHQTILILKPQARCINFAAHLNPTAIGSVTASWRETVASAPLESIEITTALIDRNQLQLCWEQLKGYAGQPIVVSFTSPQQSPLQLEYTPSAPGKENVYFVRTANPTAPQLGASRKSARLVYTVVYPVQGDEEALRLPRHLQVLGHASSAPWVGALAIRNYREFIDHFFPDGRGLIDGDGVHAFIRFRNIVNLLGVTHLIQTLPPEADDTLARAGFKVLATHDFGPRVTRLYENPAVLPKAFLVERAEFVAAADQTRAALQDPHFDPRQIAYVTGTTPPPAAVSVPAPPLRAQATITQYQPTVVTVAVETDREAFLVVTDSTTPQWQTAIDGTAAPYYVANSLFKAALVPAGQHVVTFAYRSPALAVSQKLTLAGLVAAVLLSLAALYRWWRLPAQPRD